MHDQTDDAALRAELASPGALEHAMTLALKATDAARGRGRLSLGNLGDIHKHALAQLTRHRPHPMILANAQTPADRETVDEYRVACFLHAHATQDAMTWLATLSDQLLGPIAAADCGAARVPATRSLCQAHPVWQSWCASYDAECARIDAANAATVAAQHAAYLAEAPARALAAAEATGATLALTADGTSIRAERGHLIPADVRAQLVEHKAAAVALLAEREAAEVIA